MGGFDGASMVQSMEIFDPRAGSWMTGPPMKHRRGYAAAAVLKESIYIIGGVLNGNDIVETVSCIFPDLPICWFPLDLRTYHLTLFLLYIHY